MAYGNAQRLGETINPQLMNVDFSAYERAGATTGNAIANIGQQVGGAIKQYGEDEKTIKKAQQMAKSIADAIPELKTMGDNALEQLNNKDLSQRDRLAIAEGIQDSLKIGVMGLENNRSNAMLELEAAKIAAAANAPKKVSKTTIGLGDGSEMDVLIDESGNMTDVFGNPIGGQGTQGASASVQNALPQAQGGNFPDGIPTAADIPMPEVGNYPNYGSFDQATQGVAIDGAPGVLPPRQPVANQPQYGVRSPKSNVSIPQEVTLPDGTKAYGSFADSKFVPATVDGKPMTRKLPVEEMTIEENVLSAPISIALLRTTPYSEMANQLEKQLVEAKAAGDEKAIAQISTYANTFLSTIKASPLSADSGKLTKVQEKIAGQEEIAKLITKGDKARALAMYNALAIGQGFFGGSSVTMQEFDDKIKTGEFNFQNLQDSNNQPAVESESTTDNKLNELKSQFK